MSITRDELDRFHRFAADQIGRGEAFVDFEELLVRWQDVQEQDEIRAVIERGLEQVAAGERGRPAREVTDEICARLGIPDS